jgi:hypothetical protein
MISILPSTVAGARKFINKHWRVLMSPKLPALTFQYQPDGSVVVLGLKYPVIIDRAVVVNEKRVSDFMQQKWNGPVPSTCYACGVKARFITGSHSTGGAKSVRSVVATQCGNCGQGQEETE